jgi:ornithine carbamoyltransferase
MDAMGNCETFPQGQDLLNNTQNLGAGQQIVDMATKNLEPKETVQATARAIVQQPDIIPFRNVEKSVKLVT